MHFNLVLGNYSWSIGSSTGPIYGHSSPDENQNMGQGPIGGDALLQAKPRSESVPATQLQCKGSGSIRRMRIAIPPNSIAPSSNFTAHDILRGLFNPSGLINVTTCGRLLQYFTNRRLFSQGKQLHARIVLDSVTPDNYLASKLIIFYSRADHLPLARHVFDAIPHKNIFSWNALLIGFCFQDRFAEALRLFSSLVSSSRVKADYYTVSCALKALSSVFCDVRKARELHCYVLRWGFESDVYVGNALVTLYSRCDEPVLAAKAFQRIHDRDTVSWNSMIGGFSQCGCFEECKGLYREMVASGIRPNGVTVVSLLQACGQSKDLLFGMDVHKHVVENKIEMDTTLCNALIGFYSKCGSLDYARKLFDDLEGKDEVSYGAIISGYMVNGSVREATNIFKEMDSPKLSVWNAVISGLAQNNSHDEAVDYFRKMMASRIKPSTVTISSILPSCSYLTYLKGGKELHACAVRRNYEQNVYVATAIIDAYAKSGFLTGARKIFEWGKGRSLILWTAIISAYTAHGNAVEALRLFSEMLDLGIQPDPVTFTAVLSACAHAGLVEDAWKIFSAMLPEHGIAPLVEHYACMVSVLSRAKRLSEAYEFIREMPIEPSAKVWGALLNGASLCSDVELGKLACDQLFEVEPESTGNYIVMANLYSEAGKWEEADRVREKMRNNGLKKMKGSSWIGMKARLKDCPTNESAERRGRMSNVLEESLIMLR